MPSLKEVLKELSDTQIRSLALYYSPVPVYNFDDPEVTRQEVQAIRKHVTETPREVLIEELFPKMLARPKYAAEAIVSVRRSARYPKGTRVFFSEKRKAEQALITGK